MLAALGIFLIVSVFEIRHLIIQREKREAAIYLCIVVLASALWIFLMLTPKYYSFARTVNELFNVQ